MAKPVITPAQARAILKAAGLSLTNIPAELAAWIDYMVGQSAALAETIEADVYEQLRNSVTKPRDPVALEQAEEMWRDEARRRAETLATQVTEQQLQMIGETVAQGLEEGIGPREIARRLEAVNQLDAQRAAQYGKYAQYVDTLDLPADQIQAMKDKLYEELLRDRRETIARTEAREATAEAALQKNLERGARFKVWITTGDNRVSDECQANEAEGPIAIDAEFPGGVQRPPQHPNCRCTLSFITSDDQKERAVTRAEQRAAKTAAAKAGESE